MHTEPVTRLPSTTKQQSDEATGDFLQRSTTSQELFTYLENGFTVHTNAAIFALFKLRTIIC
jgi:hypothetical protein